MSGGKAEFAETDRGAAQAGPAFRPLYRQVMDMFVKRMVDGVWSPGLLLPSELQLAAEIGVSQGTVRKALDAMAAENLVVRRQGRGTFVAEHDEKRILFQFFKLVPDDGVAQFPDSHVLSAMVDESTLEESDALEIAPRAPVARIRRVRAINAVPVIAETLTLPDHLFPGITEQAVPNSLYAFYSERYGITIAHAREKLKAIAMSQPDAAILARPGLHPALRIERVALSLEMRPVEWRVSLCLTETMHYLSFMR
jgi:GntR family transcriptional regulator